MTGPDRRSARDLERLSAYLDGQLPPGEKAALEARLGREAGLSETLDGLRQARAALRSLPPLRPPRNFTLTPEMAGVRPRRGGYPALRLATALATMAFLVVSGIDVVSRISFNFALGAAAPAPAEPFLPEAQPQSEVPAEEEGAQVERSAAAEASTLAPQPFAQDALGPTATPPAEEPPSETLPLGVGGGAPEGTPALAMPAAPTATPTLTPEPTPTPSPIPTITPSPAPAAEAARTGGFGLVQWVELLLGGAVVAFAVLSLWVRREP
jgi:anti-sigma factor RsiW